MRFRLLLIVAGVLAVGCGPRAGGAPGIRTAGVSNEDDQRQDATVRWIEPEARVDRDALRPWRNAVGPPLCRTGDRPTGAVDSLAIVSWNLDVGGGALVTFVEDLRRGHFTAGRRVRDFVLLLQEAHRSGVLLPPASDEVRTAGRIDNAPPSGSRMDVATAARQLGLHVFYVPSMRNGAPEHASTDEDRGNAILSTLPLKELAAIELPYETQRRVAVAATVSGRTADGSDWSLRVCSAHLDNRSHGMRFFASFGAGRLRQARALVDALPEAVAVLGGDFNTWSLPALETALHCIRTSFPDGIPLEDARPTRPTALIADRRLDYMFFRLPPGNPGRYRRLDSRMGSDHYPLLGWVNVARFSNKSQNGVK